MSHYDVGNIVLVQFPFTNLEATKKRPVVVLSVVDFSNDIQLYIVAMITSKIDGPKIKGDIILKSWKEENLLHPSILRLSKIVTVENSLLEKKIGVIAEKDFSIVKNQFKILFKPLIGPA